MTIRKKLEQLCQEHGLWPDESDAVVKAYEAESDTDMKRRWDDDIEGYPPEMIAVLWMGTRRHALIYIDTHIPKHFARPMFDERTKSN